MLINCKECGKEISNTAKQCPYCGAKVKKAKEKGGCINKINIALSNLFNKIKDSQKGIIIYLISVLSSCAITVCFLILTIVSFASPSAFLHSEPFDDAQAMIKEIKTANGGYVYDASINIGSYTCRFSFGTLPDDLEAVVMTTYTDIGDVQVQYHFKKNGEIKIRVFYNHYEYDYIIKDTYPVFEKAYKSYKPTNLSSAERELADYAIDLTESVIDYALTLNNKYFDFYDIIKDFDSFHKTLSSVRISSIVLMCVFSIPSICGIVGYFVFIRKKNENILLEENENVNTEG